MKSIVIDDELFEELETIFDDDNLEFEEMEDKFWTVARNSGAFPDDDAIVNFWNELVATS